MRILHVITTFGLGGAEKHVVALANGQVRAGHTVCIAYFKGDGACKALLIGDIKVHIVGITNYLQVWKVLALKKITLAAAPDVIHAHMQPAELFCRIMLLLCSRRYPLVVTAHNDGPYVDSMGIDLNWLRQWVAGRVSRFIAISGAVRQFLIKKGISPSRISTVYHGIECSAFDSGDTKRAAQEREKLFGRSTSFVVGTIGRLARQKRMDILISAFASFAREAAPDSCLVVVGEGEERPSLLSLAERSGIKDRVVWMGRRSDIPEILCAIDLFALTSDYEGFGLVLIEAMAAGKPVIASRVSAIPEIVVDGETGLLVDRGDVAGFARAMRQLASDSEAMAAMGKKGQERARARFSIDRMVSETESVYRVVV
jgi:glycosyltransferase involved in cell wall biosynthesis